MEVMPMNTQAKDYSRTLLRWSAGWLIAVLPIGVWLRSAFVWIYNPAPFVWGNLIHAHSHTAYFGWAALGMMGLILQVLPSLTGRPVQQSRTMDWLIRLAPWAVAGALICFAFEGYTGFSLVFATLNEVLWGLFAYHFWQEVKARPIREWPAALWLIGVAVALLLLSIVGTALVVILQVALKVQNPVLSNLGVYLFLQAYGDGWLEVGMMGVAAALLGATLPRRSVQWQSWLLLLLMAPAALRLLVPYGLSGVPEWIGSFAGAGLTVAQVLYLMAVWPAIARVPEQVRPWWALAAGALALKAMLELSALVPGWEVLAGERQLLIAFLHLKLLALFSAAQIGALGFTHRIGHGFFPLFAVGTLSMVGALAAHGFWAGSHPAIGHPLFVFAFGSATLAAVGAIGAVWPTAWQLEEHLAWKKAAQR
jgi:hypothetical protein